MQWYKIVIKTGRRIHGVYYRQFIDEAEAVAWSTATATTLANTFGRASFNLSEIDAAEALANS